MSKSKEEMLKAELAEIEKKIAPIRASIHQLVALRVGRTIVQCSLCRKRSRFGRFGFVQDYWYTQPSGCSGGDYWSRTEIKLCYIVCPECSVMNYIYQHPQREQIIDLIQNQGLERKEIFSTIWEKHGDKKPEQVYPTL